MSYTRSVLTKPEDKLIMEFCLAKKMQPYIGDQYLAGLWRDSLASQLRWNISEDKQFDGQPFARAKTYRAPSWSWAAVDAVIDFPKVTDLRHLITITDVNLVPIGDDVLAQVEGGHIRLRGAVFNADFYFEDMSSPCWLGKLIRSVDEIEVALHSDDASDGFRTVSQGTTIRCFPVLSRDEGNRWSH